MSYVPAVVALPKTEYALANPEGWNNQWEQLFRSSVITPQACFQAAMDKERRFVASHGGSLDASYHSYTQLLESTCEVQHRIGVRGLDALLKDGFEEKWRAATIATRRKHVLIALSEACSMARNLNDARIYCWDILKIDHLSKAPAVIVKLLKAIIPDDVSFIPKTPYYFPEPSWDDFRKKQERSNPSEIEKLCLAEMMILRNKLIYFVVEFTFFSFFGRELPKVTVLKSRRGQKTEESVAHEQSHKQMLEQLFGRNQAKQVMKQDRAAFKERRSNRVVACTHCQRCENEGEKFQRCARCRNTVQREISYCSKDCQVKDWKSRHKAICGKPFDMETAIQSSSPKTEMPAPTVVQIGPPAEGFKRSPALVLHVHRLNANPELDLMIKLTEAASGYNNLSELALPKNPIKDLLRAARDKAMTTGDKESIAVMCHFVAWYLLVLGKAGKEVNTVIEHMKAEFEYPGLKTAVLELQEKQFNDPLRRPPLVIPSISPPLWVMYIQALKNAQPDMDINARIE